MFYYYSSDEYISIDIAHFKFISFSHKLILSQYAVKHFSRFPHFHTFSHHRQR